MALQNSYRFARQYLSVLQSWVLLVISLSLSTFQCASFPFLDLTYSLLTCLAETISLCTLFLSVTTRLSSFAQRRGIVCLVFIGVGNMHFYRGILCKTKCKHQIIFDIDGNNQQVNDQHCLRAASQIGDSVWQAQEQGSNPEKWMAHRTVAVEIPEPSSTTKGVVLRSTFDSVPGIQMHIYQCSHDLWFRRPTEDN
jgi:hypothetical protein